MSTHTPAGIKKLTVAALRQELSKRGLSVVGLKPALVQRLEEALGHDTTQPDVDNDLSEDERSHKRKRVHDDPDEESTSTDVRALDLDDHESTNAVTATGDDSHSVDQLNILTQELKASHKEVERLQFQLEEAREKVAQAKQEGRREAEQDLQKERLDMRSMLDVAHRKREELEFKLAQKEEELQEHSASKNAEKRENQQLRVLKEELKKKETLEFKCEQMKDQLDDYKQKMRNLQQKMETTQLQTERDQKERERCLLEERGKAENMRVLMESHREELAKSWRKEFASQIEEQQEQLRQQIRETKKAQKEFIEKTTALEGQVAERVKDELQRLQEMQADLVEKEHQLLENDKLQEELEAAIEHRQRFLDDEEVKLAQDRQDLEEMKSAHDKERQEFEERLWTVERDVKRRMDKERELNDQVMGLMAKNEQLVRDLAVAKDSLATTRKEGERLATEIGLAQARLLSGRAPTPETRSRVELEPRPALVAHVLAETEEAPTRVTRSQTQKEQQTKEQHSQDQQAREKLLSKTRSRPSYIPKPSSSSSSRKVEAPSVHVSTKPQTAGMANKENTPNNVVVGVTAQSVDGDASADSKNTPTNRNDDVQPQRKQRASMIPIRRGSSLLPQQIKSLRS